MSNPRVIRSHQEAKEQAAEYFGFASGVSIQVDGGKVFEIPNPSMLDDDQQARWEELQFFLENCDRDPDTEVEERTITDDDGKSITIPGYTIPGEVKTPYRIDGELMKPPYAVKLAQALFGEKGYEEYKAGGGMANQIALEWAKMSKEYQKRVDEDSKSDGGAA